MGPDFALAVDPIRASRSPRLVDFLLEVADKQVRTLLTGKEKDKKKLGTSNEGTMLLSGMPPRT